VKFVVAEEVFAQLENVCFGVVIARRFINQESNPDIRCFLETNLKSIEAKFADVKVKEAAEILPYREAFTQLGINPNKFMSSIEAMATRVSKGKGFPTINPAVDLGNAISLKYLLPLGAHDLDSAQGDIAVRFSQTGDRFIPFGEEAEEILEAGELIYSVGERVKTRRWIWRQSEQGKVTAVSRNIFFPIDGFRDRNYHSLMAARDELAERLQEWLGCEVQVGYVDRDNREMEI
jgi:DNA/RNA-binding domain of Phe-tRNA-synthetase-like protein